MGTLTINCTGPGSAGAKVTASGNWAGIGVGTFVGTTDSTGTVKFDTGLFDGLTNVDVTVASGLYNGKGAGQLDLLGNATISIAMHLDPLQNLSDTVGAVLYWVIIVVVIGTVAYIIYRLVKKGTVTTSTPTNIVNTIKGWFK